MDTQVLLKELEELITDATGFPVLGKKMVDQEEVMRLIDEINHSLPNELAKAQSIVADCERRKLRPRKKQRRLWHRQKIILHKLRKKANWLKWHRNVPMKSLLLQKRLPVR